METVDFRFKGVFNWYGEIHILYTVTTNKNKAFENFVTQLSKRLKKLRRYVRLYFIDGAKDNWKIRRVQC